MICLFNKSCRLIDSGFYHNFTDYHSHLLPNLDDGVESVEQTLQILSFYEKIGVRSIWLTPHIMEDMPNSTDGLLCAYNELKHRYLGCINLFLSAEYMIDNLFIERLENDDILPIGADANYILVETSYFNPPTDLISILKQIKKKGFFPLMAHPERYDYMDFNDYNYLHDNGVKFQLNLPSLYGYYGKIVQKKAELLLKNGFYLCVGNDIHDKLLLDKYNSRVKESILKRLKKISII